jgi:hypothetical protein
VVKTHILMLQMLQELQFSVCSLGQNRGAERLHNLLYSDILVGELIFGGAIQKRASISNLHQQPSRPPKHRKRVNIVPNQAKGAHSNRLEIRVPARQKVSIAVAKGERPFMWRSSRRGVPRVPGCDFEGGAEDLGSYEFRHSAGGGGLWIEGA